jgi:hypothetical protein
MPAAVDVFARSVPTPLLFHRRSRRATSVGKGLSASLLHQAQLGPSRVRLRVKPNANPQFKRPITARSQTALSTHARSAVLPPSPIVIQTRRGHAILALPLLLLLFHPYPLTPSFADNSRAQLAKIKLPPAAPTSTVPESTGASRVPLGRHRRLVHPRHFHLYPYPNGDQMTHFQVRQARGRNGIQFIRTLASGDEIRCR